MTGDSKKIGGSGEGGGAAGFTTMYVCYRAEDYLSAVVYGCFDRSISSVRVAVAGWDRAVVKLLLADE
jgi:hypothetical protein